LGGLLKASLRAGDIACRYGGEEFVLILPEASLEVARKRAEQVGRKVKCLRVSHRGKDIGSVTLSMGIASFPEHATTAATLVEAADAALYRAKAEGRDRVIAAQ
ncbi:MAG: GGDEF domain-containing protein, partial [Candidatus Rokuibacteriota bacterium]